MDFQECGHVLSVMVEAKLPGQLKSNARGEGEPMMRCFLRTAILTREVGTMAVKTVNQRRLVTAAFLASATLLPLSASPRTIITKPTPIPGVVSHDIVPAAQVPPGGASVGGLIVSLSTRTPSVRIKGSAVLSVAISNTSATEQILWAPDAPCSYVFSVKNASTSELKDITPLECFGDLYSLPIEYLAPGMATILTFKFGGPEFAVSPGRYVVSVRSVRRYSSPAMTKLEVLQIASNPISIVVTR
jgi:hypothetical protein